MLVHLLGFTGTASSSTAQTDLLGASLVGDLMDATPSFSPKVFADASTAANSEVDLFADATFQSASQAETRDSCTKVGRLIFFLY